LHKWFDAGNAVAIGRLAWLYQNGKSGAQDWGKACEWYQKAADAGNADAKRALSKLRSRDFFGRYIVGNS